MRTRLVDRSLNPLLQSLPAKFETIHDYQAEAVYEIVEAFLDDEYRMVVLDAPTGSGKTLIAEVVRRILETRATYICHNKDLQLQFSRDFPYSRVLWGRDNYLPTKVTEAVTCGDCTWSPTNKDCLLCYSHETCPYSEAKAAAIKSPVPVLNSSYWLNETLAGKSRFANTGLAIFDEADTLDKVLMDQVEVYVSDRAQSRYSIRPPAKLTKVESYIPWAQHCLEQLREPLEKLSSIDFASIQQARELKRLVNLHETVTAMRTDLLNDIPWVYTGGAGSERRRGNEVSFKPVKVDRFGKERIWGKDKRFLLMSGSVVSASFLLENLGWTDPYKYVTVESQFHPRNRQVVVQPTADMTRRGETDDGFRLLLHRVSDTLSHHEGERGVIHSVSYTLTKRLEAGLRDSGRPIFCYWSSRERPAAIAGYRETSGAVLIAPSVDRGIDLPDGLCRWQVIVKVPYLSLGDQQVQARLYKTPDGKLYYNVHVARTIIQMVGRGVRHTEDWCVTYILDEQFVKWYRAWGHLLPAWFRKGIRTEYSTNS